MQTAVDCNGSNSNSTTNSVIAATTTTTIVTDGGETSLTFDGATSTVILTATASGGGSETTKVPRLRLQAERHNAVGYATFGAVLTQKNGNAHLIDAEEYLGSNVERVPVTPSPSPQASPSKRANQTPPPTIGVANSSTTVGDVTTLAVLGKGNSSSSSSSSSPNSNSTTSSVIASPILMRNGNAFAQDSTGNTGSGNGLALRRSTERNELLATKTLPLSSKAAPCSPYDEAHYIHTEMFTPLTPTPSSPSSNSVSPMVTTATSTSSATPASSTAATSPTLSKARSLEAQLLHWNDMPQYLQFNPYVLKGYRPLQTFKGCLLSLFYWHNETINILTHAIPIVYILAIVPGLMPWEKGYRFLSFCHVFGSVAPWCGSFVYHLFMNIERGEHCYYRLLKLDMVGIWVSQSFGALPLVTATTFCFSNKWKWFIIASYCLMSLWGLYKALTASSPWQRRLCFALPFSMRSILTCLRTMGFVGGNSVALSHVYLQDGVSIIGGAIGAMRIPEKWFPGLVDFYLNSHNIMHVLVVLAVYSMHKATMKDFEWMSATNCEAFSNATSKAIETTLNANVEL